MQKPKKRDTLVNREEYIKSYKVLSAVINYALTEFTQPWWWCLYNLMLFLYLIRVWWLFLGTCQEEITLNFLSMLFPDKQSILYSNQPTTTRESASVSTNVREKPSWALQTSTVSKAQRPNSVYRSTFNCKAGIILQDLSCSASISPLGIIRQAVV